jgi:hypothetical protein
VELALLVPLLLVLVLLIVEVSLVARLQIEATAAAREGARVAATTPDPAAAIAAVRTALGERGAEARINVHRPHIVGRNARVEVTLWHHLDLPLIGGPSIALSASAVMRVEQ